MSDIAGDLNAVTLPIPSEQRMDIFVVPGVPQAGLDAWTKQTGSGDFWSPYSWLIKGKPPASFCGVCLFALSSPYGLLTRQQMDQIEPFFKRAGKEANVFEFVPQTNSFVRRDLAWFDGRIDCLS